MNEVVMTMPSVPLRGMTILPDMVAHFDISRESSMKAVEEAMQHGQKIFLVTQKNLETEELKQEDLYSIGILAEIKQIIKLQNNIVRLLVQGYARGEILAMAPQEEYVRLEIRPLEEEDENEIPEAPREAMIASVQDTFAQYSRVGGKVSKEMVRQAQMMTELGKLLYFVTNHLAMRYDKKQKVLETMTLSDRYQMLLALMFQEIEIEEIRSDFQEKVKSRVEKHQKEYILREQMGLIRKELGEDNIDSDADQYRRMLGELDAPEDVKLHIEKEIKRLGTIGNNSSESTVARGYIETLLELPWRKASTDNRDLAHAEEILARDHYGLEKVKERVLEFLAVRHLTEKGESPILCLVGPPGTGKTSIARSIAEALDKKYVRICLGGVRDEAEIRGHRRTYVGAMPGRMINGLKQAGTCNPLMLLDEIDKMSADHRGDTAAAMLEVLDSEQNDKFRDHYVDIPVDLSEVLFLATANNAADIPKPLYDRMEVIEVSSYTENEKFHIAKEHLVAKQLKVNGLTEGQLSISDKALRRIIRTYTKEAGVRELERKIGQLCRKTAKAIYMKETQRVHITGNNLEKYLGKPLYREESKNEKDEIGIVRGLAWTSVGGVTLEIEVNTMPGKGELKLTGKMGDVMKESAQTALSYVRSICDSFKVDESYYENHDIHIHIPEGAVPKDGPSAGITLATAILSAVSGQPVHAEVAMTGEVTLRGRVLPIGGLKEKLLAAKNAGIKTVCIPKENEKDLSEISEEITKGIHIVPVDDMCQVLDIALVKTGKE